MPTLSLDLICRYQGENDMHNYFGNSLLHTGYSCLMKALVEQWREVRESERVGESESERE